MSDERLLAFTRVLADSVRSGLPMVETLKDLRLHAAAETVSKGGTLHEALAAQARFPPILVALVRAGEESGKVDAFLDRFSASLETRIDFQRRLRRALVYPAFTGLVAAAIFLGFSTKAAPLLLEPLTAAGGTLPDGVLKIMRTGDLILANWLLLLCAVLFAGAAFLLAVQSGPGRKLRALAGHWLPGIRYATEEARHYQLDATLELLLGAGLRPRQIMEILAEYFRDDPVLRRRLARGAAMLAEGKGFSDSLGPCLPPDDRTRFAVAETAGRLDEALGKLAASHREAHLHRLKLAATAVQLSATVALAPLCFGLIMSILWPTMAMLRQAGSQMLGAGTSVPEFSSPPMPRSEPPAAPPETREAAQFNEMNAKNVLSFMQEHQPPAPSPAGEEDTPAPAKKQMRRIGLKASSMQRLPSNSGRIEPTGVKSAFSD